jgi:hypothetical protein
MSELISNADNFVRDLIGRYGQGGDIKAGIDVITCDALDRVNVTPYSIAAFFSTIG